MEYQTLTISSFEEFTLKSHRIKDNTLLFSVTITTKKSFDSGRYLCSKVHAKIHYIVHTADDKMPLFNNAPYNRVVNREVNSSEMSIERGSSEWRFGRFVEIPLQYRSFGVGRTVLNLLLKKAIEIAPDFPLMDKLEPGSEEQHIVRDRFYKNIGLIYEDRFFKAERIDNLKTFETIEGIEELSLHDEFLELQKKNEELTKSLASTKKEAEANNSAYNNVRREFSQCTKQKIWISLATLVFVFLYIFFKSIIPTI